MHAPAPSYRFDRFELRPAQRLLLDDGVPLAVGSRAYDLLLVLIERRERVVPHESGWHTPPIDVTHALRRSPTEYRGRDPRRAVESSIH